MSEALKKLWRDPKYRAHMLARRKEVSSNPEYRLKMSQVLQEVASTPEARALRSKQFKKQWKDVKFREQMSPHLRKLQKNPEICARRNKTLKDIANGVYKHKLEGIHVERPVVNWARRHNIIVSKNDAFHFAGIPDRTFFIPGGKPVIVEFKKPGCKLTKLQMRILQQLKDAGYDAIWSDNKDECIAYLTRALETAQGTTKSRKARTF